MKFIVLILSIFSIPTLVLAAGLILGGEEVKPKDPIAQMTVLLGDQGGCTGVLISHDMVLTAAHCTNNTVVRFGINEIQTEGRVSDGCIRHPKYEGAKMAPFRWDLAVIKFSGGLPEGYKVSKVLSPSELAVIGEKTIIAGYGQTSANTYGVLNKAEVKISFLDEYSPMEVVLDQTQGKGACYGDSGGPAWVIRDDELKLVGITNGPYDARNCEGLAVFQRVPSHLDWIEKASAQLRNTTVKIKQDAECIPFID